MCQGCLPIKLLFGVMIKQQPGGSTRNAWILGNVGNVGTLLVKLVNNAYSALIVKPQQPVRHTPRFLPARHHQRPILASIHASQLVQVVAGACCKRDKAVPSMFLCPEEARVQPQYSRVWTGHASQTLDTMPPWYMVSKRNFSESCQNCST